MDKTLKIGLVGLGTVGRSVFTVLRKRQAELYGISGLRAKIIWAGVRRANRKRPGIPSNLLQGNPKKLLVSHPVDLLVEVAGGASMQSLWVCAMESGADVVTANKGVIARSGAKIFAAAQRLKREIRFEASVCAGVPVIQTLRVGLPANDIQGLYGILNGTTNFILSEMEEGHKFSQALAQAQELGIAEANPSSDLSGEDSLYKMSILAGLAYQGWVRPPMNHCQGIVGIEAQDLFLAKRFGFAVRLLAQARKINKTSCDVLVEPCLIPLSHPLAGVRGALNAVFLSANPLGPLQLYGEGAGGGPTASAVVSDIFAIARRKALGSSSPKPPARRPLRISKRGRLNSPYYLRFHVADKPGVLGSLSGILGRHGISISSALQEEGRGLGKRGVRLVFMTHAANGDSIQKTLLEISKLRVTVRPSLALRVANELS